jgi:nanoRNase/pAp phosphatase (c-di-AMP/oligoRNAs hydrolase)
MELHHDARVALLYFDDAPWRSAARWMTPRLGTSCSSGEIEAVALQTAGPDTVRVSLRSKGDVNVRAVAQIWGGGGHNNASAARSPASSTNRSGVIEALGSAISG